MNLESGEKRDKIEEKRVKLAVYYCELIIIISQALAAHLTVYVEYRTDTRLLSPFAKSLQATYVVNR